MGEQADVFLGFDPGGATRRGFGWSVCTQGANGFAQIASGRSTCAEAALNACLEHIDERHCVVGCGIDAPLYWPTRGILLRDADRIIRSAGGKPVSLNGLYGSVLYQGPAIARLVWQRFPNILITEVFPSAFRDFVEGFPEAVFLPELMLQDGEAEDERDARTGAFAAYCAQHNGLNPDWHNLFEYEREIFPMLDFLVEFWMPIENVLFEGFTQELGLAD